MCQVSDKPILYDGDTGGAKEAGDRGATRQVFVSVPGRKIFAFTVRKLERLGVSGVVIEDKCLS